MKYALPRKVAKRVGRINLANYPSTEQFEIVTAALKWYLDGYIQNCQRDLMIRELGFRVSRGLPSADLEAIARAGRMRTLIDGVTTSNQLQVIAEGKAARGVLERVVLSPMTGADKPSEKVMNEMFHAGEILTSLEALQAIAELNYRDQAQARSVPSLGSASIKLIGDALVVEYIPGDFDFDKWLQLGVRPVDAVALNIDLFDNTKDGRGENWLPEELVEISEAMVQDLGFSIDDLFACHQVLLKQCIDNDSQFIAFELPQGWGDNMPLPAIEYLTFSDEYLGVEDLRSSRTRHQIRRIWTSPLLKKGGRYYVFRDLIFDSLARWIRYLTHGDWPVPRNHLKKEFPSLHQALERRSQKSGFVFEDYVNELLEGVGLPFSSLQNGSKIENIKLSREIDAVVIDRKNRKIHVLEYKNISSDQNAMSIQNELNKFMSEYSKKLTISVEQADLNKFGFVERVYNLNGLKLDISESDLDHWTVEGGFVFNSHSPIECLVVPWSLNSINADQISNLFD